jgi:hypothetical protein
VRAFIHFVLRSECDHLAPMVMWNRVERAIIDGGDPLEMANELVEWWYERISDGMRRRITRLAFFKEMRAEDVKLEEPNSIERLRRRTEQVRKWWSHDDN